MTAFGSYARAFGLTRHLGITLFLAGLVAAMVEFDGTVLFLALPAVARDFHSPLRDLTNAASLLSLGAVLGLPLAALADRRGRRWGLTVTTAGLSAGNLLSGLAPSLTGLALARLIAVTFASVAFTLALVVVAEEAPAGRRSLFVAVLSLGAGAGAGLTSLLYPLLEPHWRYLYLLGGLGLVLAAVVWRWLPEGQTWQRSEPVARPLALLFAPPWRWRLAVLAVAGALGFVGYEPGGLFGAFFASRVLGLPAVTISLVLVVAAPFMVVGYLAGGWLSDRTGRRLPGVALSLAGGVMSGVTYLGSTAAYWFGEVTWALFDGAAQPVVAAWFTELFPTRARATSQAVATVAAAIGGVVGLQLVGRVEPHSGLGPALVAVALGPMLGALLLGLLPETRGKPLPQ